MESLLKEFDKSQVLTDEESLKVYSKDWTKNYTTNAQAVFFPKTTDDLVKIIQFANKNNIALVPSGGRTGLSGAALALNGEIVVSFEKMNKILDFNSIDQTVTCQAGAITEDIQNYAKEKGLLYPIDFAARGSSHIGGNVATNAGGIKVIRYGLTRNWVTSLKVVTGNGDVLELNNNLVKNASGYDFRHLFIGSEGTLGLISEVTLKLAKQPENLNVLVVGTENLDSVMKVYEKFNSTHNITAFEMFTDLALSYVLKETGLNAPFETKSKYYLLIEVEEDQKGSVEAIAESFEFCFEQEWIQDGVISQNAEQSRDFWRLREDISEATSHHSPYKNDISVKVSSVPEFLSHTEEILNKEYPDIDVVWFGHIGDGNLHINILKPDSMDTDIFINKCKTADKILFESIKEFKGSISAEHGVGVTKRDFLTYTRSETEIKTMKAIKKIFDPNNILNPGKVFK